MKLKISALVLAIAGMTALSTAQARTGGIIYFEGNVVANTCTVTTANGLTVAMGNIDVGSLGPGNRAGQQKFAIQLDCSGGSVGDRVGLKFQGQHNPDSGNLLLSSSSTATNVNVALYTDENVHQPIAATPVRWVDIDPTSPVSLNYSAWYQGIGTGATVGSANATATFIVAYP